MEKQNEMAENYACSVPAVWNILFDQLGNMLNGSKQKYPLRGEEAEAARKMKAIYREIVARQFTQN
jgi:hypothetical protein